MLLKEWLQTKGKNEQATFIVEKVVKDEHTPFYHPEYRTTPIHSVWEWIEGETASKFIVAKADHPPIDITGNWLQWYKEGKLLCAMVTTYESLFTRYGKEQAEQMIKWYDEKVREEMKI